MTSTTKLILATTMFFFGFGAMASLQFHSVLLEFHHGFSEAEIGNTLMMASATQFIVPFLILKAGKKISDPGFILSGLFLIFALCLLALPHLPSKKLVMACYTLMFFCTHGVFPLQMTAVLSASNHLKDGWFLFLRSIGTLGFGVTVLLSMILSNLLSVAQMYWLFFGAAIIGFIFSWFSHGLIPHDKDQVSMRKTLKKLGQGKTPVYLTAVALGNMALFSGTSVLGNFIQHELQGDSQAISLAWTISTFTELPMMWISIWVLRKVELHNLMLIGLLSVVLRFTLTYLSPTLPFFYFSQIFHGIFYAAVLSGMNILFRRVYGKKDLHSIQMIGSLIYGAMATTIAGKLTGISWEFFGIRTLYLFCAMAGLTAFFILLVGDFRGKFLQTHTSDSN